MDSQPLWIIGAPRSGTTFLGAVLNRHPMIALSNESRVWVMLKGLIEGQSHRPDFLDPGYRAHFVAFMKRRVGALVEGFYREELGVGEPIWGDKHPPYADPTVLSGRDGAIQRRPLSGSCLHLIRQALPASKFIHIHREPGQVARSMVRRGWVGSGAEGVAVWRQYVSEIMQFFADVEPERHLTIAYYDLLQEPSSIATTLGRFLDLSDCAPFARFLSAQRERPTPFSEPVSDLASLYRSEDPFASAPGTLALAGRAAASLGYRAV
ncbi:MAG: sulfotransferase family protein [Acetobacteraceae bacterium]